MKTTTRRASLENPAFHGILRLFLPLLSVAFRCFPLLGILALAACQSVPYTGRSHMILVSSAEEMKMGEEAYQDTLKKSTLSTDHEKIALLREVGYRLAKAADKPEYQWEFNLIDDDKTINAWCLPGGKVAIYTGIWPVMQDADGLATVLGHEIAHALARHGAERMSEGMIANAGGRVLGVFLGGQSPVKQEVFGQAYGLGVGLGVMLPHSRKQESEADHIGLILMAKAGYDPHKALEFWKRMEKATGGKGTALERYLSDHPINADREKALESELPEAMKYYKPVDP